MDTSIQGSRKYAMDCQYLHAWFSGNQGTVNKQMLVENLTSRKSQELKLIRQAYSGLYNQDFLLVLSGIRRNNAFANVVYLRFKEPQDRDAEIVRDALFGGNVNLNVVIEILTTRSSLELHSIKQAYQVQYHTPVEQDIALKTNGSYTEILQAILQSSNRYNGKVDMSMAMCDAKTLFEALESGRSVDWKTIISLISQRNTQQLKAILASYKELYGQEFSKFLKRNKCGKFGKELRVIIRGLQHPDKFLAKQLRRELQNRDAADVIARIIVSRLEIDIRNINNAFAAKTGWSLANLVRREFNAASSRNGSDNEGSYGMAAELLVALLRSC